MTFCNKRFLDQDKANKKAKSRNKTSMEYTNDGYKDPGYVHKKGSTIHGPTPEESVDRILLKKVGIKPSKKSSVSIVKILILILTHT